MKLNKIFCIILILLTLYHYYIHNGLEKTFCQTYFNYNDVKRPLKKCNKDIQCEKLNCIGMPSGHAETASLFFILLYFNKLLPLWVSLFLIVCVSVQRIITNMHTLNQVLTGSLLGLFYAIIYNYFNLSLIGFSFIFLIGFILSLLCIYKIDKNINEPIPNWVDKSMYESIKNKQNVPLYIKIGSLYINSVVQSVTYINWHTLEKYLDELIDNIKTTGIRYDAVVGIKTGGAIISDYISIKLGLPNYKIKLTREEYNCKKTSNNTIDDMLKKNLYKKQGEYTICEGINDNLEGKNIILIDELVSTGRTMEESYNYLKEEKHAYIIYPTCISLFKWKYKGNLKINKLFNGTVIVWPWGYDN